MLASVGSTCLCAMNGGISFKRSSGLRMLNSDVIIYLLVFNLQESNTQKAMYLEDNYPDLILLSSKLMYLPGSPHPSLAKLIVTVKSSLWM